LLLRNPKYMLFNPINTEPSTAGIIASSDAQMIDHVIPFAKAALLNIQHVAFDQELAKPTTMDNWRDKNFIDQN